MSSPHVSAQLSRGYIQTENFTHNKFDPTSLVNLASVGAEIDQAVSIYTQVYGNYVLSHHHSNPYGDTPGLSVRPGNMYSDQLMVMGQLWSLNIKLQDLWRLYYTALDATVTVRVYNNQPIVFATPSNSAYVVIHPSIQTDIVQGVDDIGPYYEAKVGGLENANGVIGSAHFSYYAGRYEPPAVTVE